MNRLQRIEQLFNAYIAVVVHRVPPPRQIHSRRIQQAYRLFQDANIWQQSPSIMRTERQRLTDLSERLDDLRTQVRNTIFHLRSLSV